MMKNKTFLLVLFAAFSLSMSAQVTGTVLDASTAEPIIGANVIEKGTTNGTITDFDGNFVLMAQEGALLEISYMGYKTVEVKATNGMQIQLGEDTELLDEVVVVGYGVVKKNDATGSVTAIKPDEMNKSLTTTATDMLVGKVAGVNVTTNDGTPGGGATIRVRGGSSLKAANDPLIVIDGLAMDNDGIKGVSNPLSLVNPNDIETFTVLKDASATAIYGSRASNGVILITTKKGAANQKMKVTYNGNVNVGVPVARVQVLDAQGLKDYATRVGVDEQYLGLFGDANTDWQDQIYRVAPSTDHNISLMGGTKNMPYRASIGYTLNEGIKKTSEFQRVTASVNLNPTFLDKHLTFNINVKGMYTHNRFAPGVEGAALDYDPTINPMDTTLKGFGGYFQYTIPADYGDSDPLWSLGNNTQSTANPLASLMLENKRSNAGSFVGNFEVDYKIHGFEDLRLHANFGADYSFGRETNEISPESYSNHYYGHYSSTEEAKYNLQFSAYAQYYKDFEDANQHFDAMVGYEMQEFKRWGEWENYGMYPATSLKMDEFGNSLAGQKYLPNANSYATTSALMSYFARVNWIGWNQLMLTATVRADGSSRFAPENRWGVFPSVALGWKIKETFFADNNTLSEWKLRLGYGITGQQNLNQGDFPYLPTYTVNQAHAYYTGGELDANGNYIYDTTWRPNPYNRELTWEKTTTYNAGMDLAFLNNRINFSLDYYYRRTDDLINEVDIPAGTNFKTRLLKNVGSLSNQGVEFMFNSVAIDRKNFKWDIGFNATWNTNEIIKLTTGSEEGYYIPDGGINNGQFIQAHAVGHAAGSFYVYQTAKGDDGKLYVIDQQNPDLKPTDEGYKITEQEDKIFYHSPAPDVMLGFNTKFQFYNFDLGITLRANLGNYVYNQVLAGNLQNVTANQVYDSKKGGFHNLLVEAVNAYEVDGMDRSVLTYPDQIDYFVENASFLRCDNITLGYTFTQNPKVNARLYATVSNPFVISGYRGLDPEVFSGIDNNIYPRSLNVTIGASVTF